MPEQIQFLQKRASVQDALMRALNSSATVETVIRTFLSSNGSIFGWDAALFWVADPTQTALRCIQTWYRDASQFTAFEQENRKARFETVQENLPGRVFRHSRAICLQDLAASSLIQRPAAAQSGLTCVVSVPVTSGADPIGVVEFFARESHNGDNNFLAIVSEAAFQVALFLERRRAEKSALDQAEELVRLQKKYELILASMGEGVLQLDADGNMVFQNAAAKSILGYSTKDFHGRTVHKLIHRSFKHCNEGDCPFNSSTTNFRKDEDWFVHRDGSSVPVRLRCSALSPSENMGSVLVFSEIGELLKAREQRNSFVSLLAHDLKGPLIAANRLFELLLQTAFGPLTEKQTDILILMQRSNKEGLDLVKQAVEMYNCLSFAQPKSVSILELITSCHQKLKSVLAEREIFINVTGLDDSDIFITVNETSMQHVLINLLGNAIKFSEAKKQVDVTIVADEDLVHILVRDYGCGIPDDEQDMLFRPFWQGAFGKKQFGGSGIGLYLCKQLIECCKGKISIRSRLGKGTTVDLVLPLTYMKPRRIIKAPDTSEFPIEAHVFAGN